MEDNSTDPHQRPSVALDLDPSKISLAKIFSASLHCLEKAVSYLKEQNNIDALKFSLLRLRISRLGKHHQLYQEPVLKFEERGDDVAAAKVALSDFLSLLLIDASESHDSDQWRMMLREIPPVMFPLLLEKIDTICTRRWPPIRDVPSSPCLEQYDGHVWWSRKQFERASDIISDLETTMGSLGLGDLSSEEQREIKSGGDSFHHDNLFRLSEAACIVDPWMARWAGPAADTAYRHLIMANTSIGRTFLMPSPGR